MNPNDKSKPLGSNPFDQSQHSITVADASKPDMPLIYVNGGFELVTGYKREHIIGRNCRFLQGSLHEQEGVRIMREAIAKQAPCLVDLVNFRRDGQRFINRLSLRPVFAPQGKLMYYIGLQTEMTVLKELEEKVIHHLMQLA